MFDEHAYLSMSLAYNDTLFLKKEQKKNKKDGSYTIFYDIFFLSKFFTIAEFKFSIEHRNWSMVYNYDKAKKIPSIVPLSQIDTAIEPYTKLIIEKNDITFHTAFSHTKDSPILNEYNAKILLFEDLLKLSELQNEYYWNNIIDFVDNSVFKKSKLYKGYAYKLVDKIESNKETSIYYYRNLINFDKWVKKSLNQKDKLYVKDGEIALTKVGIRNQAKKIIENVILEIPTAKTINDINKIIDRHYNNLSQRLTRKANREDFYTLFINEDIDPYLASHKFYLTVIQSPETTKKAFDYIKVYVTTVSSVNLEWVKANYKPIVEKAIPFIENHRSFKKFGVPVNILKLENVSFTKDKKIYFTFGIKDIKQ